MQTAGLKTAFSLFDFVTGGNEGLGWLWTTRTTRFLPAGVDLDSVDAAGVRRAAAYGYGDAAPIAVGVNVPYGEMLYDGFEDHHLQDGCGQASWGIGEGLSPSSSFSTDEAHTGLRSLKVAGKGPVHVAETEQWKLTTSPASDPTCRSWQPTSRHLADRSRRTGRGSR